MMSGGKEGIGVWGEVQRQLTIPISQQPLREGEKTITLDQLQEYQRQYAASEYIERKMEVLKEMDGKRYTPTANAMLLQWLADEIPNPEWDWRLRDLFSWIGDEWSQRQWDEAGDQKAALVTVHAHFILGHFGWDSIGGGGGTTYIGWRNPDWCLSGNIYYSSYTNLETGENTSVQYQVKRDCAD